MNLLAEAGEFDDDGKFRFEQPYDDEWVVLSEGMDTTEVRERLDTIAADADGAEGGEHVKDMGITFLEDIESLQDASLQLVQDPRLAGNPEDVIIESIYWDEDLDMYVVDWYYDFAGSYEEGE
jgi:hypothetical protein